MRALLILVFLMFGCTKKVSDVQTPPPVREQTVEVEYKEKELSDKNLEIKSLNEQLDILKRKLSASVLNQKDPSAFSKMTATIGEGRPVSILLVVFGEAMDEFKQIEQEIAKATSQAIESHIVPQGSGAGIYGSFVITTDSSEKLGALLDFISKGGLENRVLFVPVQKGILRTKIEIEYVQRGLTRNSTFTRSFWAGDSQELDLDYLDLSKKRADRDLVSAFVPSLERCRVVNAGCLEDLVRNDYLKATSINGSRQDPLVHLARELGQFVKSVRDSDLGQRLLPQHSFDYFKPMIQDIRFVHNLWIRSKDLFGYSQLIKFRDEEGSFVVERAPMYSQLQSPLKQKAIIPASTGDRNLNLTLAVFQMYEFVCSKTPCEL